MIKGVLAAVAATLGVFLLAQTASAQYPPPEGNLFCQVDKIVIEANGSATLTVTLTDQDGKPMAGHGVNFSIVTGSATLTKTFVITDPSGKATTQINAGTNTGSIQVLAYTNARSCRVSFDPPRIVQILSAPPTGDGGILGDDGLIASGGKNETLMLAAMVDLIVLGVLAMLLVTSSGPVWLGPKRD